MDPFPACILAAQVTSKAIRMMPESEAVDSAVKIVAAGSALFTILAGALVWIVKRQQSKIQSDSNALVTQLKASNATLADHLESEREIRERHHAENRQLSQEQHREREDRAREQFAEQKGWHQAVMVELLRARDRDHDFRDVQVRLASVVARAKTDTPEQFSELLATIMKVDEQPKRTFDSAELWLEKQRRNQTGS